MKHTCAGSHVWQSLSLGDILGGFDRRHHGNGLANGRVRGRLPGQDGGLSQDRGGCFRAGDWIRCQSKEISETSSYYSPTTVVVTVLMTVVTAGL